MDWNELAQTLLPVATLLLGAGIARGSTRREARLEAGEALADMQRHLWRKFQGDDDWVELMAYLGRLRVVLRGAGVPRRLVDPFIEASHQFWQSVSDSGVKDVGLRVDVSRAEHQMRWENVILDWLDSPWQVVRRQRAWREARALAAAGGERQA